MASKRPKTIAFRRKRENRTNYKKRLHLLLSKKPRLVVRLTNNRVIAQIVEFTTTGDKIIVGIDSFALKNEGWNYSAKNLPAAYLTGLLLAKKAKGKVVEVILDTGNITPKQKVYAFLKGAVDGGLNVPHNPKVFPADDRISGAHIQKYAVAIKENAELYKQRFAQYLKNNVEPQKIVDAFNQLKDKLMK